MTSDDDAASSSAQDGGASPSAGPWSNERDLRGDGGNERGQERKERSKEDRRKMRGDNDSNGDTAPGNSAEALSVAYPVKGATRRGRLNVLEPLRISSLSQPS